jgi:hypothetical protein
LEAQQHLSAEEKQPRLVQGGFQFAIQLFRHIAGSVYDRCVKLPFASRVPVRQAKEVKHAVDGMIFDIKRR